MEKIRSDQFFKKHNQSFFVSFTDVVFILLIFFIYLFSISVVSDSKMARMSFGIKHSLGFFEEDMSMGYRELDSETSAVASLLSTDFDNDQLVSLDQDFLFQSGGAVLSDEGKVYIERIARVLEGRQVMIVVEGHTDNTPIHTGRFPSNWHLSSVRAAAVAQTLNDSNIPSIYLKSVGYGSSRPIASNDTLEGRRSNRRVELYVKPIYQEGKDVD